MNVFILGVNGFIGHSLVERILHTTNWRVTGIDLETDRIRPFLDHPHLSIKAGDIGQELSWIKEQVQQADVVLPLAAIARPADYVRRPLAVFELDFEKNLGIVRLCAQYGTRIIFPSTSEVYGMCSDPHFSEASSQLVLGPISQTRWIYACIKQLLDRLIWAMGQEGLPFTLFRPFNWFGPGLDCIDRTRPGDSRVVTQFLGHLLRGEPLALVDNGHQQRCFTYIDDGIDGLIAILRNPNGQADGEIFNLGNPENDCSIHDLAHLLVDVLAHCPGFEDHARSAKIEGVDATAYYGDGYEDLAHRVPDITKAQTLLGWNPSITLREGLERTVAFYLHAADSRFKRRGTAAVGP